MIIMSGPEPQFEFSISDAVVSQLVDAKIWATSFIELGSG